MSKAFPYVYFLGIGGIGMSALARYFHAAGSHVSGYDRTPTTLTGELQAEGIDIHFADDVASVPSVVRNHPKEALIVLTPAVPKDHGELKYFRENNFAIRKRSEVLGLLTKQRFTIAVAGTHGKTTTSSMIAHLLRQGGVDCTAFLGGVTKNYNSNLLLPADPAHSPVVVEADEYDRSFLTLHPDIAVVTSMDADHLDIYGSESFMQESYRLFASQVKPGGTLLYKEGLPLRPTPEASTYSLGPGADYTAENIGIANHRFTFDWKGRDARIAGLTGDMPGRHNIENAVAAVAVATLLNVSPDRIAGAFASFQGVKRRFDYRLQTPKLVYIDDYAHHPEELPACITAARELYPGWKLTGIFQPHLFSRTRDFVNGFASSLSLLDEVLLLDIYPARELPIEGVTSRIIFDRIHRPVKKMCTRAEVMEYLSGRRDGVVLTLGAGDIDQMVEPIRSLLEQNLKKP